MLEYSAIPTLCCNTFGGTGKYSTPSAPAVAACKLWDRQALPIPQAMAVNSISVPCCNALGDMHRILIYFHVTPVYSSRPEALPNTSLLYTPTCPTERVFT